MDDWKADFYAAADDAAMRLSYYNAAEGDTWRDEQGLRRRAEEDWKTFRDQLLLMGLYDEFMNQGNYLL